MDVQPKYRKYLPIRLGTTTVLALVDSGNSITNACSAAVAKRVGIWPKMRPYSGPQVGTAKKGQTLQILGIIPKVELRLLDSFGTEHRIYSKLTIVDKLSSGLNISGPFLHENAIDQRHSRGCLQKGNIIFPLFESVKQAKLLMRRSLEEVEDLSISVIGETTIRLYSGSTKEVVPPHTGKRLIQERKSTLKP